ncbi:transglutaminase family protein [Candidatus Methylospira mobilis]|uniref:Transglutaminase family protein n=1 Tax=Candidatus Methylospira mobilis TaxID=1808979 RepID=A0A5Q0BHF2_9GAMM|nr:transglutaminase family protein [Candidatus Methylospira mobilis]QFY43253.1 transglutaminase family protein [Candidatus Methylospira mobilis]WNV03548.1 transglutaminase family protein [Candidatus Methylospira mobilis]
MAIHVNIEHTTRYRYDRPVSLSPHLIRLRPAPHTRTPIHHYRLDISGGDHQTYWQQDPFGNFIARAVFSGKLTELTVAVVLTAELTVINPFDFFVEKYAESYPFQYDALLVQELAPYFEVTEDGPLLTRWVASIAREPCAIVTFLVELNSRLQQAINYTIRLDPGIQSCETTLEKALGSCRDTSWLLVQILRHIGLAARFVSGYLVQLTADQSALDGPSGTDRDFTDLHAWVEVYIPGAGWVGLDPTSGLFAGEGHIPLSCTPDPVSAAPIVGFSDPCEVDFEYDNRVIRSHEDPRVTRPYSDAQWTEIRRVGEQVDEVLLSRDVRLTMGGEPTFVSIDDMESAEWTTEALGGHKFERACELLRRLSPAYAAQRALLHHGQGKWYPGEPLPRWALGCFWSTDAQPLWQEPALLADATRDYRLTTEHARRFADALAQQLHVPRGFIVSAYEDWLYYLWRESNEPGNYNPISIDGAPQYRDDLSLALARGLDEATGFALPLRWDDMSSGWQSGQWAFSSDRLYLTPGSSPMGLRLPWEQLLPVSSFETERLVMRQEVLAQSGRSPSQFNYPDGVRPRLEEWRITPEFVHAALCMEARQGRLYIFMPPAATLARYRMLLNAVEHTAAQLDIPVIIEGYEPPFDPALRSFKVTPDPGVIEVNIHPSRSWAELERTTTILYEEARLSRLAAEKFMLDGKHTGTGGGNHVTLGGATVADSPLLRRPDLLRSLLTYWQHHPALSYLFSGSFIGPTSQAPRVDEQGSRVLDDLELALEEMEKHAAPWITDRVLRNLLVDLAGNTHRAEFSIDKLFSPDSATGKLGILEFRGFEMPPHPQMSLAQMSLIRALVARFWEQPYRHKLVRWGTALHDRFMLPHFVWSDFSGVISELNEAGFPFELQWYAPFFEFRFPVFGRLQAGSMELELRMALEPWPVLGSDDSARQARGVDSSLERLQIKCSGLDKERFLVACNGRRLPLQATGVTGEYVAGVRYKAWPSIAGLHPTLPVDAPLTFDVFDKKLGRVVHGCVYHVAHPGGLAYDAFPVNAYEAETRRASRFADWGHTISDTAHLFSGREPSDEAPNAAFPCTLDLRSPI